MELVLIRHGQTDSNTEMRFCGQTDINLNETGKEQVEAAAEKLFMRFGGKFDSICSSPLSRAYNSAVIIAGRFGVNESAIVKSQEIMEGHFGIFENLTLSEIIQRYPEEYKMWRDNWEGYAIESGESSIAIHNRVSAFFEEFIKTHENGTHFIVTHMGAMSYGLSYLLGLEVKSAWRFRIDNAGAAIVRVNKEKFCYLTALNA
ncbi:MAG: histidine phosphatase family protein [Oscillospiraceae bacterium]|nr:histidine phosphatase family protein [Oscillospiraceae bacterium]